MKMRVLIGIDGVLDDGLTCISTPTKKQLHCGGVDNSDFVSCEYISLIEALPQEILIRILCGVDHDDLRRLFHVSKVIRVATLIAREFYFAYVTPIRALPFRSSFDLEDSREFDKLEAPSAPKPVRVSRARLSKKKLSGIAVALFASPNEKGWRKKDKLFVGLEIDKGRSPNDASKSQASLEFTSGHHNFPEFSVTGKFLPKFLRRSDFEGILFLSPEIHFRPTILPRPATCLRIAVVDVVPIAVD